MTFNYDESKTPHTNLAGQHRHRTKQMEQAFWPYAQPRNLEGTSGGGELPTPIIFLPRPFLVYPHCSIPPISTIPFPTRRHLTLNST